jgi:hypothetical protein
MRLLQIFFRRGGLWSTGPPLQRLSQQSHHTIDRFWQPGAPVQIQLAMPKDINGLARLTFSFLIPYIIPHKIRQNRGKGGKIIQAG